jgi:hypothetical protein
MSVTHFKLYRFTDGTRIAAASQARAEEMHAAGMRDVADIIIDGKRPSILGVVDERAESCAYYVEDAIRAT